jgi:predicted SAM-dependent methyltransferase
MTISVPDRPKHASCPACEIEAPVVIVKKNHPYHSCPVCGCVFTPKLVSEIIVTENNGHSGRHDQNQDATRLQRLLAALGRAAELVIDFGCGQGETTRFLQTQGINTIGIDQDTPVQLKDLADVSVDGIMMVEVMEHLFDPLTIFQQFARILKPGGIVYVESSFADDKNLADWNYLEPAIGHCTVHTLKSMAVLAAKNGLALTWHNSNVCFFSKLVAAQISPKQPEQDAPSAPIENAVEGIVDSLVSKVSSAALLTFSRIKSEQTSLRPEFLRGLARHFGVVTFVETGTYLGDTAAMAAEFISEVYTIELAPELARKATARFAAQPQVHVHAGDSAKLLPKILATLNGPSLLWLDGHYSEGETARGDSNTPILTELRAVQQSGRKDAVILIDDLRLFEKPSGSVEKNSSLHGYPSINQLHEAVLAIDPDYQFLILGDVALAFPNTGTLTASPVVMALTLSRLFDGQNLSLDEIFEAENILSQAQGEEREAIQWLPRQHATVERYGLGLHYRLWHALTLFGENKFTAAAEEFAAVIALGFKHWRAHWYQAMAFVAAEQFAPALVILEELLKRQPNFAPAKMLCEKIRAAAPLKLPPMLSPNAAALPTLQAAGVWKPGQPLRLHLGCGEQHFDGYVNLDYPPTEHTCQTKIGADVFADITKLQFPPQSVDEIRLHHVFEHFKRSEALALLIRWHEMLKVGGRLHLETPDLDGCARQLVSDIPFRVKQVVVRHCFGSQEAGWANHYDGWTAERYHHVLGQLGFSVQTKNWSWPHPPHLANVEAFGTKNRNLSRAELLAAADQILSEYMTVDVPSERGMCEVWCQAMRDFLTANGPAGEVVVKLQGGLGV